VRLLPFVAALLLGMVAAKPPAARAAKRALRLMTYNLNYGNPDPASAIDAIVNADADIVLLQEVTSEWKRVLEKELATRYPYTMYRIHTRAAGGLAVLSKLPVGGEELYAPPPGGWFPAQRLVVTAPFGDVQILHVHLRPALDAGSWFKGFVTTPPVREAEIHAYWERLVHALPTVIAGDFNEDVTGLAMAALASRGYARVETTGPTTWHYEEDGWDVLKMDIDHIVVGPTLVGRDGRVLDVGTSDHRPVIATIGVR